MEVSKGPAASSKRSKKGQRWWNEKGEMMVIQWQAWILFGGNESRE